MIFTLFASYITFEFRGAARLYRARPLERWVGPVFAVSPAPTFEKSLLSKLRPHFDAHVVRHILREIERPLAVNLF